MASRKVKVNIKRRENTHHRHKERESKIPRIYNKKHAKIQNI